MRQWRRLQGNPQDACPTDRYFKEFSYAHNAPGTSPVSVQDVFGPKVAGMRWHAIDTKESILTAVEHSAKVNLSLFALHSQQSDFAYHWRSL